MTPSTSHHPFMNGQHDTSKKPRFSPSLYSTRDVALSEISPLKSLGSTWVPIVECSADFPLEVFDSAVSQLIHHPEYNSTLILRSEVISEINSHHDVASLRLPEPEGFRIVKNIHRRLLPRRPTRDSGLEQHCTLYSAASPSTPEDSHEPTCLLILTPIPPRDGTPLPYYHPTVSHLAFRFVSPDTIRIEAIPLIGTDLDAGSRLVRTCLALLETLHRYGWGAVVQYRKRVAHDRLVPRDLYQDLYLQMRERHKHLVDTWKESTDPLKHVFEDIGIATYLILLWKESKDPSFITPNEYAELDVEPWRQWPRPPGGFVDLGCGNGLLTHILISEGYVGHGFDVRARTSWRHYPATTQSSLKVLSLNPSEPSPDKQLIPVGSFLIGNHADELTPWLPVLATRASAAGYLSIPCCAWTFDTRFNRTNTIELSSVGDENSFIESLGLGADGSTSSSYAAYRIWIAKLSLHCGWLVECDTLRIPSTRNWAIIGRYRTEDSEDELASRTSEILRTVEQRGGFKARRPEGKAGDH